MVRGVMVLVLVLSGCSLRNVNRATLASSTAALACDWAQTRAAASTGWRLHEENNVMLGAAPTTTQVDTYFLMTSLVNAAIWMAMPAKLRSAIPVGVLAMQADSITSNRRETGNTCGFGGISSPYDR